MGYGIRYFSCYCGKIACQKQFKEVFVLAPSLRAPSIVVGCGSIRQPGMMNLQSGTNSRETEADARAQLTCSFLVSSGPQAVG